jgi:hypothetical protein
MSPKDLEVLALEYAVLASDDKCQALASLIEVNAHIRKHVNDPKAAVSTVLSELVIPPHPSPVPPRPKPPAPTDWVYGWLKDSGDEELAQYGKKFAGEGFLTEEDFCHGDVFTDEDLIKLGVDMMAKRRKLQAMHKKLLGR